jgi:very-short-patch-repair endonuclease/plasmid stabilization system protein ParE
VVQLSTQIQDCLNRTQHPISLRMLVRQIRHLQPCAEHVVLSELRNLLASGKVDFSHGRWMARSSDGYSEAIGSRTRPYSVVPSPIVSTETARIIWGADYTDPSAVTKNESSPESDPQRIFDQSRNWGHFRALLAYYRECVRHEEGADASAFTNQLGKTFLYLHRSGNWQPRPGQPWQSFVPLGPHLAELIKALPGEGDDTALVLGYPISAFFRKNPVGPATAIIRPIFFYNLECSITPKGLTLQVSDPIPEINLGWLEHGFSKRPDRQRNFLAACGFMRTKVVDDTLPGIERSEAYPGLDNLVSAVTTFLPQMLRDPLDISFVSAEPLQEPYQTGIYNRIVVMLAKRTRYSARLLKELAAISDASDAELNSTALRHVFFDSSDIANTEHNEIMKHAATDEGVVADIFPFNPAQRRAVASLLRNNLSVITGPPGTGKSQVVAGCAANARLLGLSVLIASRNHKAIDAVTNRLMDTNGRPLLVRANSKDDPSLRVTFSKAIKQMLTDQANVTAREKALPAQKYLRTLLAELDQQVAAAQETSICAADLGEIEEKILHLSEALSPELTTILDQRPESFPSDLARNIMSTYTANIMQQYEVATSFASPKLFFSWMRSLRLYFRLRYALRKFSGVFHPSFFPTKSSRIEFFSRLPELVSAADYATLRIEAQALEVQAGRLPPWEKTVANITRLAARLEQILPRILTLDLERRLGLPEEADRTSMSGLRAALNAVQTGLHDGRVDAAAKIALRKGAPIVLQAFPVWAVTSLSVGSRLPFCPGLFDLALLDEASQSDIPSAIPLLFRAKRFGVIGDPLQLTHTSKLSPSRDAMLWKKMGLAEVEDFRFSYTQNSLYDLCAGVRDTKTVFLNMTYRGADPIAQYSNDLFYGGNLQVATDQDRLNYPPNMKPGIHWTEVAGKVRSSGGSGCHCTEEIQETISLIQTMLEKNNFQGSVGIVTPFRQQANRIQDALYDGSAVNFETLQRAQVHVDTAHGFQGDERDVIIFSLCAGPEMPTGSRSFLRETGNLFNVAVSRARAVLHVIGNRQWAIGCEIPHIVRLAANQEGFVPQPSPSPWAPHESPWEKVLFDALLQVGLQPKAQFPVRNRRLDMALIREGNPVLRLDIEVDGDCHRNPDGSRKLDDGWRDIQLQGLGWQVIRFWTYQLREDLSGCVQKILKKWEQG